MVNVAGWLLVMFVNPTNMDERIGMPFGWVTRVGPRNHEGVQIRKGKEQFWGFVRPIEKHCASMCTQQKINNDISATAAADCIAPDWPVSH